MNLKNNLEHVPCRLVQEFLLLAAARVHRVLRAVIRAEMRNASVIQCSRYLLINLTSSRVKRTWNPIIQNLSETTDALPLSLGRQLLKIASWGGDGLHTYENLAHLIRFLFFLSFLSLYSFCSFPGAWFIVLVASSCIPTRPLGFVWPQSTCVGVDWDGI